MRSASWWTKHAAVLKKAHLHVFLSFVCVIGISLAPRSLLCLCFYLFIYSTSWWLLAGRVIYPRGCFDEDSKINLQRPKPRRGDWRRGRRYSRGEIAPSSSHIAGKLYWHGMMIHTISRQSVKQKVLNMFPARCNTPPEYRWEIQCGFIELYAVIRQNKQKTKTDAGQEAGSNTTVQLVLL